MTSKVPSRDKILLWCQISEEQDARKEQILSMKPYSTNYIYPEKSKREREKEVGEKKRETEREGGRDEFI